MSDLRGIGESLMSAALETITQDCNDSLGNTITLSVQVYFQHVCHAIRAMGQNFTYCASSHFMANLSPRNKKEVKAGWGNHQDILLRTAISQTRLLLQAQIKATKIEATIDNLQDMISDHTNQSLMASGYYMPTTPSPQVLASQAEATLQSHNGMCFSLVARWDGNLVNVLGALRKLVATLLVRARTKMAL